MTIAIDMTEKVQEVADMLGVTMTAIIDDDIDTLRNDYDRFVSFPEPFDGKLAKAMYDNHRRKQGQPPSIPADMGLVRWISDQYRQGDIACVEWAEDRYTEHLKEDVEWWISAVNEIVDEQIAAENDERPRCSCGQWSDYRYKGIPSCKDCYDAAMEQKWEEANDR